MLDNNIAYINKYSKAKQSLDFFAKFVEPKEIDTVLDLQEFIYDRILNKEIFVKDNREDFYEALENEGRIFGIYTSQNRLIAYRFITIPGNNVRNMGNDVALPYSEFHKVVHLESTVVHPDFRGLGLQKLTLDYATKWAIAKGYRYLFCTVSPYNPISLKNIMSGELKVRDLKKKYGNETHRGYWRYILERDLSVTCEDCWPKFTFCAIEEIEVQQKLIFEGFVGHHYLKDSQRIAYAKCLCNKK